MWSKSCGMAMTALALLAAPAAGQEAETTGLKTIRDWVVACDNLRNCSAFGLGAEWVGAYVKISRDGGRDAQPVVTIFADVQKDTTVTLAFDDPALAGLPKAPQKASAEDGETARIAISAPADVERLLAALRKASKLTVTRSDPPGSPASDPKTSEVPLSGAVAALLYIDEQQRRLGTTTAMIRRGDKPASAVPDQPPVPTISVPRAGKMPVPAKPPAAILAKGKTVCGKDNGEGEHSETQRLNGNLLIYWFVCREMSGAYNFFSSALIAPAGQPQAARAPQFRAPEGFADANRRDVSEMLVNAGFDEGSMTLSSFSKGRGLGDCGTVINWIWNGREFVLSSYSTMPKCSGVLLDEWPQLYRAVAK